MESLHSEDFSEEQYGSLLKRSRLSTAPFTQLSYGNHGLPHCDPLDEPSPLGLRLRKSPSLLDLIQMRLCQGQGGNAAGVSMASNETAYTRSKKRVEGFFTASSSNNDRLKASNFPALVLKIGSWEYLSRYEGDLVAKCYFAKHKLVWEVLEDGLKRKIEIQWPNIIALRAECPDSSPGTLTLMLARRPAFYWETNPQPRKHTVWQATSDFTDGQASLTKLHFLQFPPGVLNKHYEKLIQCDKHLSVLSRQPELDMGSPYFEPEAPTEENSEQSRGDDGCNELLDASRGSPVSVFEDAAQISAFKFENKQMRENPESLQVARLRPSMSVSDLVNHLENQMTNGNLPSDKASECQEMLEHIAQVLLNDTTQCSTSLDEQSLMKKVNSLCSLLQDPPAVAKSGSGENAFLDSVSDSLDSVIDSPDDTMDTSALLGPTIPRRDSLGDLLLHLPRIASLPKIPKVLFGQNEFFSTGYVYMNVNDDGAL